MSDCTKIICILRPMILKYIDRLYCGHSCISVALVYGLYFGMSNGGVAAQHVDASECRETKIKSAITVSGQYAVDYEDGGPIEGEIWFSEDEASARLLPSTSFRAGIIVFKNQNDARRYFRIPTQRLKGICRLEGTAKIVIRDLETVCPGQETPDQAFLVKVIVASRPMRKECDAPAR